MTTNVTDPVSAPYPEHLVTVQVNPAKLPNKLVIATGVDANVNLNLVGATIVIHASEVPMLKKAGVII